MNTNIFFKFFDFQVKPMLLYASEIWGLSNIECIESSHLFAIKRLLCVSDKTPNTLAYGETGRYALYVDATMSAIRYWLKVLKMPNTRFPKQCLLHMTNMMERRGQYCYITPWAKKVKDCLIKHGYEQVWNDKGARNERILLTELKSKLVDEFKQEWHQKLLDSDRFAFYRSFKQSFFKEQHLDNITIKRFRDTFTRFRLGLNELGVNKRFSGQHNKNCPFCPSSFEDEHHFMFICPKYQHLRLKYLSNNINFITHESNVHNIFEIKDEQKQRALGMYIFYSLKLREECESKI